MTWTSTSIQESSTNGERWTFNIRLSTESTVANSSNGEIGTLGPVAMRALIGPDRSATYRAKWIMETFNLVVLTALGRQVDSDVIRRAVPKLAMRIASLDRATSQIC